ncbi:hypothetical protein K431DRAFT_235976 [Polychaeton citri CBS 116435]|uniref:F-box domain-containing protein n=1 Tax=Polychaeton citri CBS 116435 TaxID=1314669 RepID=A0A9P4UJA3_9PEZI|nr:hypothetical protein K431DRAFT_235976 [Polychaeton citri CBS 116435]
MPSKIKKSYSSASLVLSIPELLEQILLYLPQKDILLSQRTSSAFRYTTLGSLRLQRALFLAPDWNLEARAYDAYAVHNRPGRKPENNRLLLRTFSGCYPTVTLVIVNDALASPPASPTSPTAAGTAEQELGAVGHPGLEHWSWDVCIAFPADKMPVPSNPAVMYPEASWRRMFLSQPPSRDLHLVRRWQRSLRPAIERDGGITMGDLYEENLKMQQQPNRWHESYISSDRDWHFEGNIKCSSVEE